MIKNPQLLSEFEEDYSRKTGPIPFHKAIKIFTSMWEEAKRLGIFPLKDPLEGIEVDIRIAKVLNSCLKKPSRK